MKDIVIIGAGGFGREVAWLIEDINNKQPQWNILGFVDDNKAIQDKQVGSYKVLGTTSYLINKEIHIVLAIANPLIRRKIFNSLAHSGNTFPTIIHPSVIYSRSAHFGKGVIVAAGSILTVDISIEDFVILDRKCNVGHDTKISNFSTILPDTTLSGNVFIAENVLVGSGTTIIQGLTIGKNSLIGAGAVVTKDIPKNCTAVGVPADPIKFHKIT